MKSQHLMKLLFCEINENQFKTYTISPEQFGLQRCLKDELVGGTPKENAQITRDVLNGKQGGSRTAVLMNAGAGYILVVKLILYKQELI